MAVNAVQNSLVGRQVERNERKNRRKRRGIHFAVNFQLVVAARGYAAIGSGGPVAMGSLRATRGDRNPRKRVLKALEAAAEENAGVAPPFVIVSVKKG